MKQQTRRWLAGAAMLTLLVSVVPGNVAQARSDGPAARYIVLMRPAAATAHTGSVAASVRQLGGHVESELGLIRGLSVSMTPAAALALKNRSDVAAVMPDKQEPLTTDLTREIVQEHPFQAHVVGKATAPLTAARPLDAATTPNNPEVSPEAVQLTRSDQTWGLHVTGQGVRVAIIDSGVDFTHPDLTGTALLDGNGQPLQADFTGTDHMDTLGHGTGVAGMIASQAQTVYDVASQGMPDVYTVISGMAPDAKLMAAKIFDTRVPFMGGWDSWIIKAIDWAVQNNAQIINMSLGGGNIPQDGTDPLSLAVSAARQRGVLVMVAAGNEGPGVGSISSPGAASGAFTVGASTQWRSFGEMGFLAQPGLYVSDQAAYFSSEGPTADGRHKPDLMAPGAFGWSLAPMNNSEEGSVFQLFGGTSQATPVAVGVAALAYDAFFKAFGRYPTADEAASYLRSTATDLHLPAARQGAGRIDALSAVEAILGQQPAFLVGQDALNLGTVTGATTGNLALRNPGATPLDVAVQAVQYNLTDALTQNQTVQLSRQTTHAAVPLHVTAGEDLLTVQAVWALPDNSTASARVMIALYDSQGRFLGYQRSAVRGSWEFGHSVEVSLPAPAPGDYTAVLFLRNASHAAGTVPVQVQTRFYQAGGAQSLSAPATLHLAPKGQAALPLNLNPQNDAPGQHVLGVRLTQGQQAITVPVSYVVPVLPATGGSFGGSFHTGFQGGGNNGDWNTFPFQVTSHVGAVAVDLNWQDTDNAVELYLVDPSGNVQNGKSNDGDIITTGGSSVTHRQLLLRDPAVGTWRLIVHSFAFSGHNPAQAYTGHIRFADPLTPGPVNVSGNRGQLTTVQVPVTNPGAEPMTVIGYAESNLATVQYTPISGTLSNVPAADGSVNNVQQFLVPVMPDATNLGLYLFWDNSAVPLSAGLYDGMTWSTKSVVTGSYGALVAQVKNPVFGQWLATVDFAGQVPANMSVNYHGSFYATAPKPLSGVVVQQTVIQPGQTANVPVVVQVPGNPWMSQQGYLLLASDEGDILARVPFSVRMQ